MCRAHSTAPIPAELLNRADAVLELLFELDGAVANGRAFRAMLEELHHRDLTVVAEPHISAIIVVRAGLLRGAIGAIMSCLDPSDRRGNRASVGQILELLRDEALAEVFAERATSAVKAAAALAAARRDFDALCQEQEFKNGRALRNESIAHVLVVEDPAPAVHYETFYELHDAAEKLVKMLYVACDRGEPKFIEHEQRFAQLARIFWDTHFAGMDKTTA